MLIYMCCVWIFLQVRPVVLECDRSMNTDVREVTKTENKVALTGIALVRDRYCIGNADDIAKIPKRNLEDTTRAMFIPVDQKPWHVKVKDYMVHPEYDYATMSSIALIELNLEYVTHFPVTPICWPPKTTLQTTTDLYVVGYTDENKLLEKMLYRVEYVTQDVCKEYYERQQPLIVERLEARNTICAVAQNNMKHCEWDNGMVMASNSTGIWTLIGFSLQGPSCSAPSRFIDLTKYLNWIETSSTLEPEEIYRKSGGDTELHEDFFSKESQYTEFRTPDHTGVNDSNKELKSFEEPEDVTEFLQDITSHETKDNIVSKYRKDQEKRGPKANAYRKFRDDVEFYEDNLSGESQNSGFSKSRDDDEDYSNESPKNDDDSLSKVNDIKIDTNDFRIQRIARNAISINFNTTTDSGDCTNSKAIVYSESMPLRSNKTNFGIVILMIPVIDLKYKDYDCLLLKVISKSAHLWYNVTRTNSDYSQQVISNRMSKEHKREHHNRKKHFSDILFLKLKFVFTADFKYVVYSKENITNNYKNNLVTKKVVKKLKEKVIVSDKVSAKATLSKKVKPRIKTDINVTSNDNLFTSKVLNKLKEKVIRLAKVSDKATFSKKVKSRTKTDKKLTNNDKDKLITNKVLKKLNEKVIRLAKVSAKAILSNKVKTDKNITNNDKDKLIINKVQNKLKENVNRSVEINTMETFNKQVKPRIKNNKRRFQMELAKRNVEVNNNNIDFKQILQMTNNKSKEITIPLALHYDANKDEGFFNSFKSVILGMYKNYITVSAFLTLLIIFVVVYVLLDIFVRKGYVRL